jgi:Txe/YoeB family toxin of toxin-antitoxin system
MLMSYEIQFHKRVFKDLENIKNIPSLCNKAKALLKLLENNPYEIPPSYEKLTGTLKGFYSRRLNKQYRLIYLVDDKIKTVKIVSMWTHYEQNS